MNENSNRENVSKKGKKVLSEEEFNKELKKQVNSLKKMFDDYSKNNNSHEEER